MILQALYSEILGAVKMSQLLRQQVDAAAELGNEPRVSRGGSVILNVPGARYRTLVTASGNVTAAGRRFYDQTGREPPASQL